MAPALLLCLKKRRPFLVSLAVLIARSLVRRSRRVTRRVWKPTPLLLVPILRVVARLLVVAKLRRVSASPLTLVLTLTVSIVLGRGVRRRFVLPLPLISLHVLRPLVRSVLLRCEIRYGTGLATFTIVPSQEIRPPLVRLRRIRFYRKNRLLTLTPRVPLRILVAKYRNVVVHRVNMLVVLLTHTRVLLTRGPLMGRMSRSIFVMIVVCLVKRMTLVPRQ